MALITYADKQAMGTQPSIPDVNKVTDSDMNQIKNVVNNMEPSWCVATITTKPTVSSEYFVPLNFIHTKQGNFTLQDGGIRIGSGINHIRVSACVFVENFYGGDAFLWARVYKNNNMISTMLNSGGASYLSAGVPITITSVSEGDIIKLMADSGQGGTLRDTAINTWLCVEKID